MGNETWVLVEHQDGRVRRVTLEAIGKLTALDCAPIAVVAGADLQAVATVVSRYVRRVLVLDHPELQHAATDRFARAFATLSSTRSPTAIVAGATSFGRDVCARLAARLRAGYVADATELTLTDQGDFMALRPVLGGRAYAQVAFRGDGPRVISVRPNVFPAAQPAASGVVESVAVEPDPPLPHARLVQRQAQATGRVDLTEADMVVAGGRGVRGPDGFKVVETLAEALGAAVGASRSVVDAGWRDHSMQIGKSGRTVSPKLYIALGISGAVHHRMGMDTARTVVVVNADANAPFFKHADYGIVGDLFQIAPALAEEVERARRAPG